MAILSVAPDVASRPVPGPEGYNSDDIMKNIESYPFVIEYKLHAGTSPVL